MLAAGAVAAAAVVLRLRATWAAALGRSSVQIATRWYEARLAYARSAVAAALDLAIAVALARPGPRARRSSPASSRSGR